MHPTSEPQFEASRLSQVPGLESVRADIWAVGMALPQLKNLAYSLLYLLRDADGGVHVIDPGLDSDENWGGFLAALEAIHSTPSDVRSITATHLHTDHLGMAERMRSHTGAPIILSRIEQETLTAETDAAVDDGGTLFDDWGVPPDRRAELEGLIGRRPSGRAAGRGPLTADRLVDDGDGLGIPGFELIVMHTPGHTSGSISLRDDTRDLLFTGDHLLPTMFPGLGLGGASTDNPLQVYLEALDRIAAFPTFEALPGHGYRFTGIAGRAAESAEHHLFRSREVAALVRADAALTTWQIASRLTWTAGWNNLRGFYTFSALMQTAMHREFVAQSALDGVESGPPPSQGG